MCLFGLSEVLTWLTETPTILAGEGVNPQRLVLSYEVMAPSLVGRGSALWSGGRCSGPLADGDDPVSSVTSYCVRGKVSELCLGF